MNGWNHIRQMARLRTREADAQRAREADLRALNTAQAALRGTIHPCLISIPNAD
jgi:hypothetical protein